MKEDKPWQGICSKSCWYAQYDKCTCKCGGKNHRRGYKDQDSNEKPDLSLSTWF